MHLPVFTNVCAAVGNTPLIRLKQASEQTGCEILGKAEMMNPGQSVKDRAALGIIKDALERGALGPGGLVVEGTAGNTGIGLATIGAALGLRTTIVIPRTQTQEKKDALRLAGAHVVEVDAVPYTNPGNYQKVAERMALEAAKTDPQGAIWAGQFDNTANRRAHYETTGPEIWQQTQGRVDGFVSAIGTGGTLWGVGTYLKEQKGSVRTALADPHGAAMYSYFTTGELKSEGESITEGIGQGRVTGNVDGTQVDHAYRISDEEALNVVFDLAQYEGLVMGGSVGINVAGAIRLAEEMGPGHVIVTILCDYGHRYQSKVWNPDFLRSKGLPTPSWLET